MRPHSCSPVVHKDERVFRFHTGAVRVCLLRSKGTGRVDISRLVRPNRIRLQQTAYPLDDLVIGEFGSYQHLGVHCHSDYDGNGLIPERLVVGKRR